MAINGSQDFETSLYKKTAGKILHLILDTIASKVLMNNGKTVEYEINNVKERAELGISIGSKAQNSAEKANSAAQAAQNTANLKLDSQWAAEYLAGNGLNADGNKLNVDNNAVGGTFLYDGTIDFDDEEQVAEITEDIPDGTIVAFDCCSDPDCPTGNDPVYINGIYNTKEYITETGSYIAPVTGEYKITIIDGGSGAYVFSYGTSFSLHSGDTGRVKETFVKLNKGQEIPVVIGAAGIGVFSKTDGYNLETFNSTKGGKTTFGDIGTDEDAFHFNDQNIIVKNETRYDASALPVYGQYYGGGGYARVLHTNQPNANYATNGADGCIIVEYYDAAKDKNISIDMASSITIKELQSQIVALDARVQELENNE